MLKVGDKFKIGNAEYLVLSVSEFGAKVRIVRKIEDEDGNIKIVKEETYISANTDV